MDEICVVCLHRLGSCTLLLLYVCLSVCFCFVCLPVYGLVLVGKRLSVRLCVVLCTCSVQILRCAAFVSLCWLGGFLLHGILLLSL